MHLGKKKVILVPLSPLLMNARLWELTYMVSMGGSDSYVAT